MDWAIVAEVKISMLTTVHDWMKQQHERPSWARLSHQFSLLPSMIAPSHPEAASRVAALIVPSVNI
jgi:hypothetical protein